MNIFKSVFRYFKHHRWITIGIFILIILLAYLFRPKPPKPVDTITVKQSNLVQSVSISGKVAAKNVADLSFQVGGKLTYLGIKTGDMVTAGQTIATVDTRTAQKNLQAALIDYSKQRNTFDQTQSDNQNRTPQEALNDQMKRILEDNQYDLDKAVNSVELQSLAEENSFLTTPISGIVTRADAKSAGINIVPTTVFEVTDPNSLVFDMDVDEADIGKVAVGQQTNVVIDAYPDETLKLPVNYIDFVSHTTSNGGDAFTVEVALNDPSASKYRVGMNGNADIITNEKDNVITIPISALQDDTYVYIKNGSHFEKKKIKVGLESDTDAEVISGLTTGDVIAADPTAAAQQTK